MRPACKYVHAGLREPDVKVLAEIGTEGLPLRRDHAGNRVDFVSLIDRDKVDRVTRLDADQVRIKDEEPVGPWFSSCTLNSSAKAGETKTIPAATNTLAIPSCFISDPSRLSALTESCHDAQNREARITWRRSLIAPATESVRACSMREVAGGL